MDKCGRYGFSWLCFKERPLIIQDRNVTSLFGLPAMVRMVLCMYRSVSHCRKVFLELAQYFFSEPQHSAKGSFGVVQGRTRSV